MAIFNNFPGSKLLLLVLVLIVCSISFWGLPFFTARTEHAIPAARSPEATAGSKTAPVEKIANALAESKNQDVSTLSTEALWKNLLAGFQHGAKTQIGLENALIERLRQEPDSAIYQELLAQFRQGGLEAFAQQVLVSLLGEVGNHKSAETLMSLVNEALLDKPDVKLAAFNAISKFAPESWYEHPNTEFAPVFEAAWQTENAEFWSSIANVMASIGTPATLDIFIETLTDDTNAERVDIVKQAMTNLVNPALIPKLAESLENSATKNVQLASGNALANMGEIGAASTLFDWSAQVDVGKIDLVKQWFETAVNTTPEFIAYLEKNLADQKFASPEIKQAIKVVLKDAKNGVE
jgi:hypothetical protein